jgi:hypothetical protein
MCQNARWFELAQTAQRSAMREVLWLCSGLNDALRVRAKLREQHREARCAKFVGRVKSVVLWAKPLD